MATAIDYVYALMAGRAYQTTRDTANWFPVPDGWVEYFHVPNNPDYPQFTGAEGFEAVAFQNVANPNEIVISFAGTGPAGDGDWLNHKSKGSASQYFLNRHATSPTH